ncbi:MAG: adenine phosphoribosyltransferase [Chthonomonadales bacterium]|nr:adenine phosphoribosyltransferase [Chthonomonadales bacterium]
MGLRAASLIRDIPDFPEPGIVFKDITPILRDPQAYREVVGLLSEGVAQLQGEVVCGVESRGFLFGAPVALDLGLPFVPLRKPGKLPYRTTSEEYELEYGSSAIEIHVDAINAGERVVIIDDLLATGGTAAAANRLIARAGGVIAGSMFVIELGFLKGRDKLTAGDVRSLILFE